VHALADRLLIAQNTYPDGGGISSILENLIVAVGDRYEVHVAVVEARPGAHRRLPLDSSRLHILGYNDLINPVLFPTSLAYAVCVGRWLSSLARRLRPSAIIVQDGLYLPVPGVLAARAAGVPLAVMDHGTLTNVYEPGWARMVAGRLTPLRRAVFRLGFIADIPWRALRWRLGVRLADQLWFTGSELEPYFGSAGDRVRRYAQLVPQDFRPPTGSERLAARRALGVDPGGLVVNMVGRLDGEKGLDNVVEAVRTADLPSDVAVVIAGDGSLRRALEREISRSNLEDTIRLVGGLERDAVRRLHHASDIHIYAGTFSCGVSICLLEAMASGVIPIASDVPAAQGELVGNAGWVFPAGDTSALRHALEEATTASSEHRAQLSARARERVFTGQRGSSLIELVDRLMAGS
jgi:glycosyltransferase involved in cell wall biosynthesis